MRSESTPLKINSTTLEEARLSKKTIGFVPTMGALHEGHLSLIRLAAAENDLVVVSIFVNPTQFNNPEDLKKYPRMLEADLRMLDGLACAKNVLTYAPTVEEVYGSRVQSQQFNFGNLDKPMEGAGRPGHFDGVGTIVSFLFETIRPHKAYFGEKDFQQLKIIEKLVDIKNYPIEVIRVPISREPSGLARSSRNTRLSIEGLVRAADIYQSLILAKGLFNTKSIPVIEREILQFYDSRPWAKLEYFVIAREHDLKPAIVKRQGLMFRAFIVVHIEGVRLIDNMAMV